MGRGMITSRKNPLAQRAREARDGRARDVVFVEGLRLCEEAASAGLEIEDVLFTEEFASGSRASHLLGELRPTKARLASVSESVLASVADTKTPQGIALLARRPACDRESFARAMADAPLVVVLHGVNNPANAGAVARVAEAAGAAGLIATAGSTDLLSPKSLRASAGSAFRLPLWAGATFEEVIAFFRERGVEIFATDLGAGRTSSLARRRAGCRLKRRGRLTCACGFRCAPRSRA